MARKSDIAASAIAAIIIGAPVTLCIVLQSRWLLPYVLAVMVSWVTANAWLGRFPGFSLRTLLIATTLVAVVLGLGVWLVR